jgi:uncharacterized protein (DUF1697 family)
MTTYIALLRAINVGGDSRVAMADLTALFADLGFANPHSLLQTGNLVFQTKQSSGDQLEAMLEEALAERLSLTTDVFVRTSDEWRSAIEANPFPREAADDPSHLVIMPLKAAPTQKAVQQLQAAIHGRETIAARGRELYIVYPDGIGRSKLTNKQIETRLGARVTGRNWNTALKIAAASANRD